MREVLEVIHLYYYLLQFIDVLIFINLCVRVLPRCAGGSNGCVFDGDIHPFDCYEILELSLECFDTDLGNLEQIKHAYSAAEHEINEMS